MSKYLLFFATNLIVYGLLFEQINATRSSNVTARIVGGQIASIENFRYLVQIYASGFFTCGGTLISRNDVVTAGHCVNGTRPRDILVIGGATTIGRAGVRRRVRTIYLYQFNPTTLNRDVAVLKLASPMTGTNIQPIGLCNSNWRTGDLVTLAGWGSLIDDAKSSPAFLRSIQLPLISKARCQRLYRGFATLSRFMFCASTEGRRDSCSGDSGGPVIYRNRLCGIVSWGFGCGTGRFPGVYTSIKQVQGFIRRSMRKN